MSDLNELVSMNYERGRQTALIDSGFVKEAKSRLIKVVERLIQSGQRDKAMRLLSRAEQGEGLGSYASRAINEGALASPGVARLHPSTLTPGFVGGFQEGSGIARQRFYGGRMNPVKYPPRAIASEAEREAFRGNPEGLERLLASRRRDTASLLQEEARISRDMARLARLDPEVSNLVEVPRYGNLVGTSRQQLQDRLSALRAMNRSRMTRNQRGELADLQRRLSNPEAGYRQGLPMQVPPSFDVRGPTERGGQYLSAVEERLQQQRALRAADIFNTRYNPSVSAPVQPPRAYRGFLPPAPGFNTNNMKMTYSTTGRPTIRNFEPFSADPYTGQLGIPAGDPRAISNPLTGKLPARASNRVSSSRLSASKDTTQPFSIYAGDNRVGRQNMRRMVDEFKGVAGPDRPVARNRFGELN